MDEMALAKENFTLYLINRDKKGGYRLYSNRHRGTKAEDVIKVLMLIGIKLCNMVKEFTPDMANSM
ncbi:hypothetical protein [Bacteroides fragilis]|uniref:hypothetical protein n=1 Tax=Bacteroides fragilis TaxID=817 RepID=UPI002169F8D1|nr:hypothetical protein [Bacteroides fragilis]